MKQLIAICLLALLVAGCATHQLSPRPGETPCAFAARVAEAASEAAETASRAVTAACPLVEPG